MSNAVTVFTYGEPTEEQRDLIGNELERILTLVQVDIVGRNQGIGSYDGDQEFSGAIVTIGLTSEVQAAAIGSWVAFLYGQSSVGVIHNQEGRTLATPSDDGLHTGAEVYGD